MGDPGAVDLQLLRSVVSSLERIVSSFYGPQSCQTLMTSSTGKAVVTSDGYTILQAILAAHPLATVVTKAITSYHGHTYDGCKIFIIYLSRLLDISDREIANGKFSIQAKNVKGCSRANVQQNILCISKSVRELNNRIMPRIYHQVLKFCRPYNARDIGDITRTLKCVGKTTIMPHYNPKLCGFLTELLGAVIDGDDLNSLRKSLQFLLDNFSCLCIRLSNQPYDKSYVSSYYIIQRDFVLMDKTVKDIEDITILLVDATIDKALANQEPAEIVKIHTSTQLNDSLICKIQRVQKFADNCVKLGVNVVILSAGVPQYALDIFRANRISVVHHVLEEDILLLEKLSGVVAAAEIDDISATNCMAAKRIQPVSVGGRRFVQLLINSKVNSRHLILCAPTVGLCDQLYLIIQKAIKAMSLCLKKEDMLHYLSEEENTLTDNDLDCRKEFSGRRNASHMKEQSVDKTHMYNIFVTPGGGGFELLVSESLQYFAAQEKNHDVANVCRMISEALMYVLHVLHRNTSEYAKEKHSYVEVEQYLKDNMRKGVLLGLNRRGVPGVMADIGIFEPTLLKVHVLECVLVHFEQLLRIDRIVSVGSKPSDQNKDV